MVAVKLIKHHPLHTLFCHLVGIEHFILMMLYVCNFYFLNKKRNEDMINAYRNVQ